jgi:hypothetical protein
MYAPPPGWVPVPPPEPPHPRRVFSLMFSPFRLLDPIVELTGEARVHDRVGVALMGGVGRYTDKPTGITAGVYEAGVQVRAYVLGDFRHGMQLGAEATYLHLDVSEIVATAEGLLLGPFIGYKVMADGGFTFDTQFGIGHITERAQSASASASGKDNIPFLNLNIGWSF